jgi:hypothetical protein
LLSPGGSSLLINPWNSSIASIGPSSPVMIQTYVFEKQAKYLLMNILIGGKLLMKIKALYDF